MAVNHSSCIPPHPFPNHLSLLKRITDILEECGAALAPFVCQTTDTIDYSSPSVTILTTHDHRFIAKAFYHFFATDRRGKKSSRRRMKSSIRINLSLFCRKVEKSVFLSGMLNQGSAISSDRLGVGEGVWYGAEYLFLCIGLYRGGFL